MQAQGLMQPLCSPDVEGLMQPLCSPYAQGLMHPLRATKNLRHATMLMQTLCFA